MDLAGIDGGAVARALAQIVERDEDFVEAFFERSELIEAVVGDDFRHGGAGLRMVREEGLAVRLRRGERSWMASRDALDGRRFAEAVRQVARVQPRGAIVDPPLASPPPARLDDTPELADFPRRVERAVRARHAAFPVRFAVRRHRRVLQVVGARLVPAAESELFWSVRAELPWGVHGGLYARLDEWAAENLAEALLLRFRARDASPPPAGRHDLVLGADAAAVFLHEAVAHALEVDSLALAGNPSAAIGVALGASCLDVLDDPAGAPEGVRRATDDEGSAVVRRWLLRAGVVEQPLADLRWAARSAAFLPGGARRASRHAFPGPRSHHLELVAGAAAIAPAPSDDLYLPFAERGALDPRSGVFTLEFPCGLRRRGETTTPVGRCRLRGRLTELLAAVAAVGGESRVAGAGWCAKGGQKLPVWARTPEIVLRGASLEAV
jgi:predicted Zn-dependent protease